MSKYRISEALTAIYKLIRDDFSGWYLELIKPAYGQPIDTKTLRKTEQFLETLLAQLHPFMPFITEELWQALKERQEGESLMVTLIPEASSVDNAFLARFAQTQEVISAIRNIRTSKNLSPREELVLEVAPSYANDMDAVLMKLANLTEIRRSEEKSEGSISFVIGTDEFAVPMANLINAEEEIKKLEEDLEYQKKFLLGVEKKLSNENFVARAPEQVIALERKKKADAESRIQTIEQSLKQLKGLL